MERIHDTTVDGILRAIRDQQNPTAARDALIIGNNWLEENDNGILQMSQEARARLEKSLGHQR